MLASAEDSRVNGRNKYEIARTFEYVGGNNTKHKQGSVQGAGNFKVEVETRLKGHGVCALNRDSLSLSNLRTSLAALFALQWLSNTHWLDK